MSSWRYADEKSRMRHIGLGDHFTLHIDIPNGTTHPSIKHTMNVVAISSSIRARVDELCIMQLKLLSIDN